MEVPGCRAQMYYEAVIESCILPSTGTYLILAYDSGKFNTGNYNLYFQRLYTVPGNTAPIHFGQTISATIDSPGEMDVYTFSAAAGDNVLVRLVSTAINPAIRIHGPDGMEVPGCRAQMYYEAVIESCILPSTGTYLILAYDSGKFNTGNYNLYFQRLYTVPGNTAPIHFGQTISATIDSPGEMDVYTFSAAAGDNVLVRLVSTAINPAIRIHGPDGMEVPGRRAQMYYEAVIESCILPSTGTYLILAYDSGKFNTGNYQLTLGCNRPLCGGPVEQSVVLIYAVLDNNLGDDESNWNRLFNNAELGMHLNAQKLNVHTHLLIDSPGGSDKDSNAHVYQLQPDTDANCPSQQNPDCSRRYKGDAYRTWSEDTAHPDTLAAFAIDALQQHATEPIAHVTLILAGHGGGWSANALPGQPSRWGQQDDNLGGMLWDDNPGNGGAARSMSTAALGYALDKIKQQTGRTIDVLYLDACSMGTIEVAYEVRSSVRFLLASPNTDWASFAYDSLLAAVDPQIDAQAIARAWLAGESQALRGGPYPFVLAIYQLDSVEALAAATKTLAARLTALASTRSADIEAAFAAAVHYESDYNGQLDSSDKYVDLGSFLQQLASRITDDPELTAAIQAVNTALAAFVLDAEIEGGRPWPYPGVVWEWPQASGMRYLPADWA